MGFWGRRSWGLKAKNFQLEAGGFQQHLMIASVLGLDESFEQVVPVAFNSFTQSGDCVGTCSYD